MANTTDTEEDPSIEEILDSIRQIISEDEDEGEDEVDIEPTKKEPEPDVEDEKLDQSAIDDIDFDTPEPEVIEPIAESETVEEEKIIELTDRIDVDSPPIKVDLVEPEPDFEPEPEPEIEPEIDLPPEESDDDNILTKNAENAAFDAISELARKTVIEHNGITLEEIVRSEIKPMLRTWLDKNLPIVIERLVSEELERVSKRVMED